MISSVMQHLKAEQVEQVALAALISVEQISVISLVIFLVTYLVVVPEEEEVRDL